VRRRVAAIGGAVAALVAVACSSDPGALPEVPDFTPAATTTTGIDYSEVSLKGVTGKSPTTSVVFGPGQAAVSGTVISDEGAIPGATIQVERIVSGSTAVMTIQSADDGTWALNQVLGGRYRVRAWRAPDLAQTSWTAVFLEAAETKTVQLRVRDVGGLNLTSSIAPDPPRLGEQTNLVVQVTLKVVDEQGVVRATPQDNVQLDLVNSSGWRVESANPTLTNADGRAAWTLRCRGTGSHSLAVTIGTQTVPLEVSDCVEPPEETTTTTAEVGLVP
jgi:hypothetical protein